MSRKVQDCDAFNVIKENIPMIKCCLTCSIFSAFPAYKSKSKASVESLTAALRYLRSPPLPRTSFIYKILLIVRHS